MDWPSREVPDALAQRGLGVISQDGPDTYNAYEPAGAGVRVTPAAPPEHVDLVYAHRPIDELPDIVALALTHGAAAVWFQSGRDRSGAKDPHGCWIPSEEAERARRIVEEAGLAYIDAPYIAEAFATRSG